jgi:RNA polymerase primary sigma factor
MVKDIVNSYYNEIRDYPTLTIEEERELAERIVAGDLDALDKMVLCNLKLVMKISHDFKGEGVPLIDLIQEGNIGLITAAKKFNPDKGKFSTYAAWWIKRHMRNSVYKQSSFNLIEIPQYIAARIAEIKKIAEE